MSSYNKDLLKDILPYDDKLVGKIHYQNHCNKWRSKNREAFNLLQQKYNRKNSTRINDFMKNRYYYNKESTRQLQILINFFPN